MADFLVVDLVSLYQLTPKIIFSPKQDTLQIPYVNILLITMNQAKF